ncbi:hypothetical protein FJV83_09765 [Mesorhizobium sp. WSM4307]|uniref:hypothetical protein n=1 Tax=unclassified Mesorhizobium TaxID=325217 RepID=UPI000BB0726B|nr:MULTISPECIES: hypothetical protein [unclassified Mesorhizobium]PBB23597.1 hypothetical protein CK232_27060 [Mesorhizobium sp. WSM4304]PBB72440.1 hypothetical protein CK227_26760 [Mesorhizobium sp. WSM4308]PBC20350.1 hypothetical protein CK226_25015 [Mesorhizobium sp. WSM4311]TRC77230.1 hypothetical protein FJV81_11790 [Mesorhizobium sp. WSM4315]TRC86654.1 hypothetical protein FJV83_09765 [Mesorhizobium sp. WSM4307]
MSDFNWSTSEKKLARHAFDTALETALAKTMAEFKSKAGAVTQPSEMWELEDYLRERRRDIDRTFDYRYSQLLYVFAQLIRAGYLDEKLLVGLSQDKRDVIQRDLAFVASRSASFP